MILIETKRHPLKFYAIIILCLLFLFVLGLLITFFCIENIQNGQLETKEYIIPIFGAFIYFLLFLVIHSYWKNSPKVTIDGRNLKIGNEVFSLKNIKDVVLTGKVPFRFIINFPMEGATILFNDGTERILFDDMYINIHQVKSFLEQVVLNKQEFKPNIIGEVNRSTLQLGNIETFKGNQLTSLRGISLWGGIGVFAFLLINKWQNPPIELLIFFGIFGVYWFIVNSLLMYYFGLTKDYLVVRNHNFIWSEKIYCLTDVKEIVFETGTKQPNCMRVITNDFKGYVYRAGTLEDKTWLEMKKKLEAKGINVRNECIYE